MINIRSSFDYSKDWPQTCLTFPRVKVIFEQLTTESTHWHTLSSCRSQKFKKKKTSLTEGCEGGRETDLIKFRRPKRQFALTVVYS